MKELVFEDIPASDGGFLDGPCKLPSSFQWPTESDGKPLFHLLSVPLSWVFESADKSVNLQWISVFVCYDKENYSHYEKMSSDDPENSDSVVIIHDMSGDELSFHSEQSKFSKNIKLISAAENDDNVASYIGGVPYWVQDPIEMKDLKWAMSIYGPDMDEALGENRGIFSDGTGYLFIPENIVGNINRIAGRFFLQL